MRLALCPKGGLKWYPNAPLDAANDSRYRWPRTALEKVRHARPVLAPHCPSRVAAGPGGRVWRQPTLYVCTPTGKILKVDGTSGDTTTLYSGTTALHDCVFGPDGRVYAANGNNIVRIDSDGGNFTTVTTDLDSAARGLAFNVTTLYINTESSGVLKMVGTEPSNGQALTFSGPEPAVSLTTAGQGIVFDNNGNMLIASDLKILESIPPLIGDTPYGTRHRQKSHSTERSVRRGDQHVQ